MRRLAIVVLNFPAPEDRRVWALATAAQRGGWDVTVISPALRGHRVGAGEQDGVQLRWFRSYERWGPIADALTGTAAAARLVAGLALGAGDVVHVCTPPDSHPLLLRWLRRKGVSTLYDQHDVVPLLAASKAAHRRLVPVYTAMERATVRHATATVTAGQVQADRIGADYGVNATVIRTAAPLLDLAHVPPATARVLGYLGVMGEQDGVDILLRAMRELHGRGGSDVVLDAAGDGPELPRLRRLADELGISASVKFRGWVQEADIEAFLAGVDGFVVPDPLTDFNHSCPMLKVSHALGAGIPVVLTPLRENLALTGGAGFVAAGDSPAQLADAIEAWAGSSADERAAQGTALRARWRSELDPEVHMRRYLDVLESVSTTPPSGARE